jgi:Zn-dependent protease
VATDSIERTRSGIVIFGVTVRVNWLWVVLTAVIIGITMESLAPEQPTGSPVVWYLLAGVVLVGIIASLLLHDTAHILAARQTGANLRSIEPALLGNLSDSGFPPSTPRNEALVAAAGPIASLGVAALLLGVAQFVPSSADTLARGVTLLGLANLIVFAIGIVPGFPYDGGRALRAFVWYLSDDLVVGTRVAAFYGQFLALFGFVLALAALAAGEPYSVWGAWALLFLWAMGRASHEGVERTVWVETARATTVSDVVMGATTRIDAGATIDNAIDEVLNAVSHGPILVTDDGTIAGVFSLARIRRIPRTLWTERQVRDVSVSIDGIPRISADASVAELLDLFSASRSDLVLVTASGDARIIGALDLEIAEHRLRERISSERRRRRD